MNIIKNVYYCDVKHGNQTLDVYIPESKEFSVFVFFHGGGLESGDKEDVEIVARYLLEKNIAVVSVNYRMYPTAVYPEFIRDAAAAVAWTYRNINHYGKCDKFYVGGSSAGAYLSMMLCFDERYLMPYGISPNTINGYIHNAGQPTCHFNILRERNMDSRRVVIDESAPLFYVGTSESYAPMLFIVSDNDMENRYEQIMLMVSTMKHFGYEESKICLKVVHGGHCEHDFMQDEVGKSVFGKMIFDFITGISSAVDC